jgi:hypothetical protein
MIRQPDAAVGTGVHAWCLRHREGHCRGHWSVCAGHEVLVSLDSSQANTLLSVDYVF